MPSGNLTARMYFDQGKDAYAAGQHDNAADYFRNAVETDPQFVEAHRFLAEAYEKLGYGHRAKKAWEALLRITKDPGEQEEIRRRMGGAGQ